MSSCAEPENTNEPACVVPLRLVLAKSSLATCLSALVDSVEIPFAAM
jgi:hypothetical protein